MTAVLALTPQPGNVPPRMVLTVTGGTGTTVTISRTDGTGSIINVRGVEPAALSGGSMVAFDYEMPYNQTVSYTARFSDGSTATASGSVNATGPWLVHPGIPSLSQPLIVVSLDSRAKATNQGVHRPLGRDTAVVITDGQRQAETFNLVVRTETLSDEAALDDLVNDASSLLLQIGYPSEGQRTRYSWVSVGNIAVDGLVDNYFPGLAVHWTMPCTVSSRPIGTVVSQRLWPDVVAELFTWADAVGTYSTWRDLIIGDSSGGGGVSSSGETYTDNGDGSLTATGQTDNGDGSITVISGTDNGDGTVTVT